MFAASTNQLFEITFIALLAVNGTRKAISVIEAYKLISHHCRSFRALLVCPVDTAVVYELA